MRSPGVAQYAASGYDRASEPLSAGPTPLSVVKPNKVSFVKVHSGGDTRGQAAPLMHEEVGRDRSEPNTRCHCAPPRRSARFDALADRCTCSVLLLNSSLEREVFAREMATTIALLNMKGGVGKTTLGVTIAWYLCRRRHKRVLLVDLDPQFNSSQYVMSFDQWEEQRHRGTVADLLLAPTKNTMPLMKKKKQKKKTAKGKQSNQAIWCREIDHKGGRFDLIPSELDLARAIKNPHGVAYKLEKECEKLIDHYDYILIDCAPTDSVLTDTAFMASDYVLVPIKPDRFSVLGFGFMQEALANFKNTYPDPHGVQDLGVVFTQVMRDSPIEDECMSEVTAQADYVFNAVIPFSQSYRSSVHYKTPVFDTPHCYQSTKTAVRKLVDEIEHRINVLEGEG